jgi:hypothetical protein
VVEMSHQPTTHMPVVHITIECATRTAHADGAFRTLVAVTDAELREGAHLREAARRASIIGFGGPHRVLACRRLDAVTPEVPAPLVTLEGELPAPSMSERLELLLTLVNGIVGDAPEPEAYHQATAAARRQQSKRRAGARS